MKPDQIISVISRIHENANRIIIEELEKRGVDGLVPSHGDILAKLFKDDGMPMSELARLINRKKNTVSVLVEKLELHGYIRRSADTDDNRITRIYLTAKGKAINESVQEISKVLLSRTYKGISPSEKESLIGLLTQINSNLEG